MPSKEAKIRADEREKILELVESMRRLRAGEPSVLSALEFLEDTIRNRGRMAPAKQR